MYKDKKKFKITFKVKKIEKPQFYCIVANIRNLEFKYNNFFLS